VLAVTACMAKGVECLNEHTVGGWIVASLVASKCHDQETSNTSHGSSSVTDVNSLPMITTAIDLTDHPLDM